MGFMWKPPREEDKPKPRPPEVIDVHFLNIYDSEIVIVGNDEPDIEFFYYDVYRHDSYFLYRRKDQMGTTIIPNHRIRKVVHRGSKFDNMRNYAIKGRDQDDERRED